MKIINHEMKSPHHHNNNSQKLISTLVSFAFNQENRDSRHTKISPIIIANKNKERGNEMRLQ